MQKKKIFIAGHKGLLGQALVRAFNTDDWKIIVADRTNLDLCDQQKTLEFFTANQFDQVIIAAGKVGGIKANSTQPADFIYQNMMLTFNIVEAARQTNVDKGLVFGSSCMYPKYASQPISESELLNGRVEITNEAYAMAKVSGVKLCSAYNAQYGTDFRVLVPANLYGIGDNLDPENSHVIPGMMKRFHDAKMAGSQNVDIWGSGNVIREFLFADDLADACRYVMSMSKDEYQQQLGCHSSHINIGSGASISIKQLAREIARVVGFEGGVTFDTSKPDGMPKKVLNSDLFYNTGWVPKVGITQGLSLFYEWFLTQQTQ